ncbi:GNAT family N-acetyltransferase [Luteolibacter arcticus]|uniref:GNAT family N-acetyltransferase n=1 Tax=Luteolibacter arcticus TaxID=1581411 RepID=A0ABT3GGW4_9BACT|nr:GNAT family N-acetyltransferase [Luteolibacter arcticus]MCW1922856.1 GNAT family N-acetyltransferase [Luteolibacter arcticus]
MFPIADRYWEGHLNCPAGELFSKPLQIVIHGEELQGYRGALALFRDGAATVSIPPDRATELRGLLDGLDNGITPAKFAEALSPVAALVLGPAYLGYTTDIGGADASAARALNDQDAAAVESLRQACSEEEWDHGGPSLEVPCSGVFCDGQLAALAGYEIWSGTIAHIYIVTHPGFRSRGFGRIAVAHLAKRALAAGLLAQYRTLDANTPSIRIAESLGFQRYATSMAVRLDPTS